MPVSKFKSPCFPLGSHLGWKYQVSSILQFVYLLSTSCINVTKYMDIELQNHNVQKYFISILSLKIYYFLFLILQYHFICFLILTRIHSQFCQVLNINGHFQISYSNLLINNYNSCLYQINRFISNSKSFILSIYHFNQSCNSHTT